MTLAGFRFTREAYRHQVEAQFQAAARDRAESVVQGLQIGFDDVAILSGFFEASGEVSRRDFDSFLAPILARHPYIQALQWLPEVKGANRSTLEAEARRTFPAFRYFCRDEAGRTQELAPGETFFAVH